MFKDIDLLIKKEVVFFLGERGSGKSTLVDIIVGLYKEKEGQILIDGIGLDESNLKNWKKR